MKLGIIDGIGDMRGVLKERFGDKVRIVRIAPPKQSLMSLLSSQESKASGGDMTLFSAEDVLNTVEARLHWSRWGF